MTSHEKYLRAKLIERYPNAHNASWEFEYHEQAGILFGFGYKDVKSDNEYTKQYPKARYWKIAMGTSDALYSDGNVISPEFIGKKDYNLQGVKDATLNKLKQVCEILSESNLNK